MLSLYFLLLKQDDLQNESQKFSNVKFIASDNGDEMVSRKSGFIMTEIRECT